MFEGEERAWGPGWEPGTGPSTEPEPATEPGPEPATEPDGTGTGEEDLASDELLERYRCCASDDLVQAYSQLVALERATRAQALCLLGVIDEREAWRGDGAPDAPGWVAARESLFPGHARDQVEMARALVDLPHLAGVARRGEVSADQLRFLCRLATPDTDAYWAHHGPRCTPAELARLARRQERVSEDEAADAHRRRALRWWWGAKGTWRVSGRLRADQGQVVANALSGMAQQMGPAQDGTWEPFDARAADALTELASAFLGRRAAQPGAGGESTEKGESTGSTGSTESTESPESTGDGESSETPGADDDESRAGAGPTPPSAPSAGDRAQVIVHVNIEALGLGGDGMVQTHDGTPLAPQVGRRLACDAKLALVLEDPHGVALGIGRRSRVVPGWLEDLVRHRDGYACRFPGCARTRATEIHHLVHWADGGPTDAANLVVACGFHHHLVHDQGWRMGGDADRPAGLWVARPDGRRWQPHVSSLDWAVAERFFGPVLAGPAGPAGDPPGPAG